MHTLFISDLHLSSERPEKLELFKKLLRSPARQAEALYILGDLFEAWAGDDDMTSPHPEIIKELSDFTASGSKLFLMRGNRDYLIGNNFVEKTGGELINDPVVINLNGENTLLMHGDTLCTRDYKYQIFRRIVNNPVSIRLFLLFPFVLRKTIWHGVRNVTRQTSLRKSSEIVDVYQPAVEKIMRQYNVYSLIHGHTHQQAIHDLKVNGISARRYVLGDWYEQDSILVAENKTLRLMRVQEYLDNRENV